MINSFYMFFVQRGKPEFASINKINAEGLSNTCSGTRVFTGLRIKAASVWKLNFQYR